MTLTDAIGALFGLLNDAGYEQPAAWRREDPQAAAEALDLTVQAWSQLLCDLTPETLTLAGVAWIRQDCYRRWPVPGQLLEVARDLTRAAQVDGDAAWGMVKEAARRHSPLYGPAPVASAADVVKGETFLLHPDERVAAWMLAGVNALGGWRRVGLMEDADEAPNRASFRSAYQAAQRRGGAMADVRGALEAAPLRLGIGEEGVARREVEYLRLLRGGE